MSKNRNQRLGIFDLENSSPIELVKKAEEKAKVDDIGPAIMLDVALLNTGNNRISARTAFLICKEQMRLSNIRPQTIKEYEYNYNRFVETMQIDYLDEITLE